MSIRGRNHVLAATCALAFAAFAAFGAFGAPGALAEGTLGWGNDTFGQLGDGVRTTSDVPVATAGLTEATQVAAGYDHSAALLADGTVVAWGDNRYDELGNPGAGKESPVPVPVEGLSGVLAISAGRKYTLALLGNGTVDAWGYNAFGQLGDGTTANSAVPVQVHGLDEVVAISAGLRFALALLRDGTVMAWGYNGPIIQGGELGIGTPVGPESCTAKIQCSTVPVPVEGIDDAAAIAAGYTHSLAVLDDGTMVSWGADSYGELGVGPLPKLDSKKKRSFVPLPVKEIDDVTAIAAGNKVSVALRADGTVWTWGKNNHGELGIGTIGQSSAVPVQVPGLSEVTAVAAGGGFESGGHDLALLSDGTLLAWGSNRMGELGDGTDTDSPVPVPVGGVGAVTCMAAGDWDSLACGSLAAAP